MGEELFNKPICEGAAGATSNGLTIGSVTCGGGLGGGNIEAGISVAGSLLSTL